MVRIRIFRRVHGAPFAFAVRQKVLCVLVCGLMGWPTGINQRGMVCVVIGVSLSVGAAARHGMPIPEWLVHGERSGSDIDDVERPIAVSLQELIEDYIPNSLLNPCTTDLDMPAKNLIHIRLLLLMLPHLPIIPINMANTPTHFFTPPMTAPFAPLPALPLGPLVRMPAFRLWLGIQGAAERSGRSGANGAMAVEGRLDGRVGIVGVFLAEYLARVGGISVSSGMCGGEAETGSAGVRVGAEVIAGLAVREEALGAVEGSYRRKGVVWRC